MPDTTTLVVLAAVALALAGGAAYWAARLRAGRKEAGAAFHHFRCPGCKRRLRFQARQVGHKGQCSHCGSSVTFPPVSQAED